jgi:hypothetical protein
MGVRVCRDEGREGWDGGEGEDGRGWEWEREGRGGAMLDGCGQTDGYGMGWTFRMRRTEEGEAMVLECTYDTTNTDSV